jgi:hypothetical protein
VFGMKTPGFMSTGPPGPSMPAETRAHVDGVVRRVEATAPDDLRRLVLLVAEVHEEREPDALRSAAKAAGAERDTDAVVALALAFGEVWTVTDAASCDDYVGRHAGHLRALLLFELAHEGAATDAMRAVADRSGLGAQLGAWEGALD